ncbi:MAG: hypothetical protein ICV87_08270, partial [Gemmatimonadetes bacterium]|nr:hypothetical protein [Gemmatimonadota bacterium]
VTTVPFPVAVLERVEDADAVTGVVSTDVYQYAEGYYDAVEQTFRGFGFVQTQNTVTWGSGAWSFPAGDGVPHAALREGARVERLWSYVGAFVDEPELMAAYRRRFFSGDPDAVPAGPSILLAPIRDEGGATVAEAARALSGAAMRREVYAVELSGEPAPVPFQVAEHSFTVEMVQPARDKNAGSFNVIPRQSVSSDYEQVADDPRVAQDATLAWDAYGRPTQTVQVAYPRRKPAVPAQGVMTCLLSDDDYAVAADGSFLAGPVWRTREWEAAGMSPANGSWFTYDDLAAQSAAAAANPVDYGAPFTGGPQARLLTHDEAVFWNADQSAALPDGECTVQTLVHHNREAVFPEKWPAEVYGSRVDAAMLKEAGYYPRGGYWWRDEATLRYWAEGFYQARSFQTPFQAPESCTTVEYDAPYWLVATRVTDAVGHAVTVAPDYQTLEPATITDENGVATEALYDPLGRVLVMSQHGTVQGAYRGGMQLANYQRKPPPTLAELMADPGAYLQGARAFFHPLLAGWTGAGSQPASMAAVAAREDANQPDATAPTVPPAVSVTYLDGSGRTVEALQRVERAAAAEPVGGTDEWVWLSGERVEYDPQDRVHRTYIPAYAESPVFAPAGDRPYTAFTYDALDREVREDTPKGFFSRTERPDAWTEVSWDFDDTVLESRYYLEHEHDPDLPPAERRALEIAARFADTPSTTRSSPQGFTLEEVEV